MSAVVGRVWSWINPANLYRPWGSKAKSEISPPAEGQQKSKWSPGGVTSWVWGGWRKASDQTASSEEFWEAQEEIVKALEVEDLKADRGETPPPQNPPSWWNRFVSPVFYLWPTSFMGFKQRKSPLSEKAKDPDAIDGDFSDYGTPPPSPVPLSIKSTTFRFFAQSWSGEILPEHYEICFNFLRHLFDLFVVGFLWTVSPPAKFVLEVLGVQGALKLWLHGMAMFLVSSVGMAGLLWLVQEYLPQFALVYGIAQALVISVSVRQSVILGTGDDERDVEDDREETDDALGDTQRSGNVS